MKIGLLDTCIGNFGQKGFYNTQELGLGKALVQWVQEVFVYKLAPISSEYQKEEYVHENGNKLISQIIPSRCVGSNGLLDTAKLEPSLDVLVYFSDTQLIVPELDKWSAANSVKLIPYIGVIESHSTNSISRAVINLLFRRNLAVYKKHSCMTKNPRVAECLKKMGVSDLVIAPVGLDLDLLHSDYEQADIQQLKQKYGYTESDKVLLFVGRLIEEKQPLRMIDIFAECYKQDSHYKLLLVGTGELADAVSAKIEKLGIGDSVQLIARIPNQDIWELYRIADCFVNLNQQEIFGMAILEAMYYGCKVVAWEAPGPGFIIEDGISGCLADSDEGILQAIFEKNIDPNCAKQRVLSCFTWENTAKKILKIAADN